LARRILNLGILAHVDAGKTTLTERLLFAAGAIETVGSVDAGTTRTDTLALERARGITIRSAVVSFEIADVKVNLIDTPGHPDFIAEVDRILSLLDGAVLVISAVEGVQPQTRVLMRALRRLRVPTLLFINKIDRSGADPARVLDMIGKRLVTGTIPMGSVDLLGTRAARFIPYRSDDPAFRSALTEVLADQDESLLAAFLENEPAVPGRRLRRALVGQTRRCQVYPVFLGSAITGEGVDELRAGLVDLLPARAGDPAAACSGRIFKIDRGPDGGRIAYVRMFAGTVHLRQRLRIQADGDRPVEAKPTGISVCDQGGWIRRGALCAGEIGRLWGLGGVRIGDTIGQPPPTTADPQFAPPTLQTIVTAVERGAGPAPHRHDSARRDFPGPHQHDSARRRDTPAPHRQDAALRAALTWLAEQDPLINVQVDDTGREVVLSLYGEVQQEVIQATLAMEYGLEVTFRETTTICVERPVHPGEAVEAFNTPSNPFNATIGLRVEPGPPGSGVRFRLRVEPQMMPLYLYKNADTFERVMDQLVRRALREGRYGWQVTDCLVTMIDCEYPSADGPPSKRGPMSTPADFRHLTPMVLMAALDEAGTVVSEPTLQVSLEVPAWANSAMLSALGRLGAAVRQQVVRGDLTTIEAVLPAARVPDLRRQLPGLTAGEGALESTFDGYRPVRGDPPTRPRTTADPRRREEYLRSVTRQGARG
jgi:ribosomal protection tetracycline resistance protein